MTETRRLSRAILVRTSEDLASRIEAAASGRGISSAAFLRQLAADAVAGVEPRDRRRSVRREPRPELAPAEPELRAVVRDLGRMGGALVMIAKALREGKHPSHGEAERTLAEARAAASTAAQLVERLR